MDNFERAHLDFISLPEDPEPIATDWRGAELYPGDMCYFMDGFLIRKDDLKEYVEHTYGRAEELEG